MAAAGRGSVSLKWSFWDVMQHLNWDAPLCEPLIALICADSQSWGSALFQAALLS